MGSKKLVLTEEELSTTGVTGPKIRCPKCEWQPRPDDVWGCDCGHVWHTFDTGGVCPACVRQWEITVCLSCHVSSAHSSWYDYDA